MSWDVTGLDVIGVPLVVSCVDRLDGFDGVFRRAGRCLARVSTLYRAAGRRRVQYYRQNLFRRAAGRRRAGHHRQGLSLCHGRSTGSSSYAYSSVVSWDVAGLDGIDGVFRRVGRCLARVSTFHRAAGRRRVYYYRQNLFRRAAGRRRAGHHRQGLSLCHGTSPGATSSVESLVGWQIV